MSTYGIYGDTTLYQPSTAGYVNDKTPPCDVEAERATLGAVLLQRDAIVAVDGWLLPNHFYLEKHAWVYEGMVACYHRRVPPDMATVADELRRTERLELIGGLPYLIELVNAVPTAVHIEYYGRIVERTAVLRKLISAGGKIAALGYREEDELETTLANAEIELRSVTNAYCGDSFASMHTLADQYFERLTAISNGERSAAGLATGFVDLDALLGGLQRADLLILAARPSVGKTSLMLSLAAQVARLGAKVAAFSLEMSKEQYFRRFLAMYTGISTQLLRTGQFTETQQQQVVDAMSVLSTLSIHVEDSAALSISQLRARAHQLHASVGGLDLILVDYLQLMTASARIKNGREQEVSEISRGLKALARELDVPLIAISQLSRAVEGRASHVPMLSDLRESGQIEADADLVLLLYKEELYDPDTDKKGIVEVHIAKQRNGPTGIVPLRFDAATTRFSNLERFRMPEGY